MLVGNHESIVFKLKCKSYFDALSQWNKKLMLYIPHVFALDKFIPLQQFRMFLAIGNGASTLLLNLASPGFGEVPNYR